MRKFRLLLAVLVILAVFGWQYFGPTTGGLPPPAASTSQTGQQGTARLPAFLPAEAHDTLARIRQRGPFPYRQDGTVFQNRERHLPARARGYYREYTVPTPGARSRGARRIVTGGNPPEVYYYTDDHYRSFRRFEVPR